MAIQQPDNLTSLDSPDWQGENLIFLISQPRAGSTMLQKILGGHPDIHTLAEPWIMLHPCYGLKNKQCLAEYEAGGWAGRAARVFLGSIGGEQIYYEGIRAMGRVLYSAALEGSGKTYFMDKTPRYYYIINELKRAFPGARFIILLRNPLAMLCSLTRTWIVGHWFDLPWFRDDLMRAPAALKEGIRELGDRAFVIRYEDLVKQPETILEQVQTFLGVSRCEGILNYGRLPREPFKFGDTTSVWEHDRPQAAHADQWEKDLERPWMWRFARDYLNYLQETDGLLPGYDVNELEQVLKRTRPSRWRQVAAVPLPLVMKVAGAVRRLRILFGT